MFHLHLAGLLTFELLALIAAVFLRIYIDRHSLGKWYRHFSKVVLVMLHLILVATIVHGIIHHFHSGHHTPPYHNGMEQHPNH